MEGKNQPERQRKGKTKMGDVRDRVLGRLEEITPIALIDYLDTKKVVQSSDPGYRLIHTVCDMTEEDEDIKCYTVYGQKKSPLPLSFHMEKFLASHVDVELNWIAEHFSISVSHLDLPKQVVKHANVFKSKLTNNVVVRVASNSKNTTKEGVTDQRILWIEIDSPNELLSYVITKRSLVDISQISHLFKSVIAPGKPLLTEQFLSMLFSPFNSEQTTVYMRHQFVTRLKTVINYERDVTGQIPRVGAPTKIRNRKGKVKRIPLGHKTEEMSAYLAIYIDKYINGSRQKEFYKPLSIVTMFYIDLCLFMDGFNNLGKGVDDLCDNDTFVNSTPIQCFDDDSSFTFELSTYKDNDPDDVYANYYYYHRNKSIMDIILDFTSHGEKRMFRSACKNTLDRLMVSELGVDERFTHNCREEGKRYLESIQDRQINVYHKGEEFYALANHGLNPYVNTHPGKLDDFIFWVGITAALSSDWRDESVWYVTNSLFLSTREGNKLRAIPVFNIQRTRPKKTHTYYNVNTIHDASVKLTTSVNLNITEALDYEDKTKKIVFEKGKYYFFPRLMKTKTDEILKSIKIIKYLLTTVEMYNTNQISNLCFNPDNQKYANFKEILTKKCNIQNGLLYNENPAKCFLVNNIKIDEFVIVGDS